MKIVAMVKFNGDWAYVFDAPVALKYREETIGGVRYLVGQDGPFYDFLGFEKARGRFKAFAGRVVTIQMDDGSTRDIQNDWWSCGPAGKDLVRITYNDVESLKRCYVYGGGYACPDAMQEMVDEYENRVAGPYKHRAGGWRYDYYDFEKVIRFDDTRKEHLRRQFRLEKANRHLVRNAKEWAAKASAEEAIKADIAELVGALRYLADECDQDIDADYNPHAAPLANARAILSKHEARDA